MSTIIGNGTLTSLTVDGIPWLPTGTGSTSQTVFEAALRDAYAGDTVLNWLNGDVTITAPIQIDILATRGGLGLAMNGSRILCDFNDATKWAITYRIPPPGEIGYAGIAVTGPNFQDITFFSTSPAAGAIKLEALTNQSWIGGFLYDNIKVVGFQGAGPGGLFNGALMFLGSVFEGHCENVVGIQNNHTFHYRNSGTTLDDTGYVDTDVGIVSAIWISGGTLRDGHGPQIMVSASQLFREPDDFTCRDIYIVDNNDVGLYFAAGATLIDGCGFEGNNGAAMICHRNATIMTCRASNPGAQPYLVSGFMTGGAFNIFVSGSRDEGGGSGSKLGAFQNSGTVNLVLSGTAADVDVDPGITVTHYP